MDRIHTAEDKNYPIRCCVVRFGDAAPHLHTECELVMALRGNITVQHDSETSLLQPGQPVFINSRSVHRVAGTGPNNATLILKFNPREIGIGYRDFLEVRFYPKKTADPKANMETLIQRLMCESALEFIQKSTGYEFILYGHVQQILGALSRGYSVKLLKYEDKLDNNFDSEEKIREILEYAEHCTGPITLSSTAHALGISHATIEKLMKSVLGITFSQYVQNVRMDRARWLLLTTDRSVLDISLECGFENISSFYRVFKKVYNDTPQKYRSSNQLPLSFERHALKPIEPGVAIDLLRNYL